jgi:hypothetical protein
LAQEKVCIPNVWKGDVIKGKIYLQNGDSLEGKFTHLTPVNTIKTSHIIYQGKDSKKREINRKEVVAYYDKKSKELRYKVYITSDSVHVKKNCFFDKGRFLLLIENGRYKLLEDELTYNSSITAYNQGVSDSVYYILPPDGLLIKVQIKDLKAQLQSILIDEDCKDLFKKDSFSVENMIETLRFINSN